jgi:hypothetical protein
MEREIARRPERRWWAGRFVALGAPALVVLIVLASGACRRDPVLESLTHGALRARMAAAARLARDPQVANPRAIDLLSTALTRELADPTREPKPEGAWFTAPELAAWGFVSALATRGSDDPADLRAASEAAHGELRSWLLLARGRAGETAVGPDLVPLLASPSPAIRAEAATLVGQLGERSAVPGLRRLLGDPFEAPQAVGKGRRYPVRQVAAEALRSLGVHVRPTAEPGGFEVVPRPGTR